MNDAAGEESLWRRLGQEVEAISSGSRKPETAGALRAAALQRRAERLRKADAGRERKGRETTMIAFTAGRERYAIAVDEATEVQPLEQFTAVPGAPGFIRGVVQHRGKILTLIDLGRLFGLPEQGLSDIRFFAIVHAAGRSVAVAVGELEDILTVPVESIRSCSGLRDDIPSDWVAGVHDENRLLLQMRAIVTDPRLTDWQAPPRPND